MASIEGASYVLFSFIYEITEVRSRLQLVCIFLLNVYMNINNSASNVIGI